MKKIILLISFLLILFLIGCSNNFQESISKLEPHYNTYYLCEYKEYTWEQVQCTPEECCKYLPPEWIIRWAGR